MLSDSRSVYHRYEAIGDPFYNDDLEKYTRFKWIMETGVWKEKLDWVKMKNRTVETKTEIQPSCGRDRAGETGRGVIRGKARGSWKGRKGGGRRKKGKGAEVAKGRAKTTKATSKEA